MAKKYNVEIEVLSSLKRVPGTIVKEVAKMEKMLVRGVTKDTDVARISVTNIDNTPGIAFKLFSKLAQKGINVDIILQSVGRDGTKDITFTVAKDNAVDAIAAVHETFDIDDKTSLVPQRCKDLRCRCRYGVSPRNRFKDVRGTL